MATAPVPGRCGPSLSRTQSRAVLVGRPSLVPQAAAALITVPAENGSSTIDFILDAVCKRHGIDREGLVSRYRGRIFSEARAEAAHELRIKLDLNLKTISAELRRTPTCITYLITKHAERVAARSQNRSIK